MTSELVGWASSICLGLCAYPQIYTTWKTGNTDGLSLWFLVCWQLGEVLGLWYVLTLTTISLPLVVNYAANTLGVGYLLWKKWRG